jgi:sporulation protein YlmC with PRC-barrel domain
MTRFLYNSVGRSLYVAAAISLVATAPVLAQNNSTAGASAPSSDTSKPGTMALGDKAPNGSLTKTHDDWRASELVGATVYNDQGDSIGTVNDLLIASDGTVANAILSVGGFLGIGTKLVQVPFKNLKLVPSQSNPASGSKVATQNAAAPTAAPGTAPMNAPGTSGTTGAPATPPNATASNTGVASTPAAGQPAPALAMQDHDYSLVLPGATKDSLTSDPSFKFED